jgi:predicted alpha/beta hydrolase family esterase
VAPFPSRRFLVLHGWQNRRPRQHWQWQLVEALRRGGEQALYPQLPDPDRPSLDAWTELVHAELAQLGQGERIVIAHSLAVPLWLHIAREVTAGEHVDRVLLAAPPSPRVLRTHEELMAFAEVEQDALAVAAASTTTRLVCSDNDPYCPEGGSLAYAAIGLDADVIPDGQHLDPDAGYGAWPAVLHWCHDPSVRLTPRPHVRSPQRLWE